MQVECGRVVSQQVLSQRRHADDASSLVHMFDPLFGPAQVGVGNRRTVTEIQLDVGSYGVTLGRGNNRLMKLPFKFPRFPCFSSYMLRRGVLNLIRVVSECNSN